MRRRFPIVHIENAYRHDNRQPHQHHGEEEIFAEQWQCQRCRRYDFRYQQEEHGLREQDADTKCNFLARVSGKVEDEHRQVGDANAWNDQVDGVEECLATECDVEEDVGIACEERRENIFAFIFVCSSKKEKTYFSSAAECVREKNVRFSAAWIILFMSLSWHTEDIPLDRRIIFTQIDAELDHIARVVRQLILVLQVNLHT